MATIHWKQGVNGSFDVAANWNPASVPGASDVAAIDAAGTYTVTVSAAPSKQVASLNTAKGATLAIAGGTFAATSGTGVGVNAGTVTVSNNNALLAFGGTFTNTGKIALNAVTSASGLEVLGSGTLAGGGKVTLSDNAGNFIFGSDPFDALTNVDNTIAGAGTLTQMSLLNGAKGVINATGKNNAFILNPGSSGAVSNAGLLEATGSGRLVISGIVFDEPTGVIQAVGAAARVVLNNAAIVGGKLKTTSGGTIQVPGTSATLVGSVPGAPVYNGGSVVVDGGATLTLSGTINNSGSIALKTTSNTTTLRVGSGGVGLSGGGKVTLSGPSVATGETASATLVNVDNTIAGAGTFFGMILSNGAKGVINASVFLDFEPTSISNAGLLEATSGGTLLLDSTDVANAASGVMQAVGSGSRISLLNVDVLGGTLKTTSGGIIEVLTDSEFDGSAPAAPVNNAGRVVVDDGVALTLRGTINNTGSIALQSTSSTTPLRIADSTTLSGGGKITLSDSAANQVLSTSLFKLTNVDNIIAGAGTLGTGTILTNSAKGVINATGKNHVLIVTGSLIHNDGLIETAVGAKGLTISSALVNYGKLLAAGGDLVIAAPVSGTGSAVINRGGEIEFAGGAGITQNVTFANIGTGTATLKFDTIATSNPNLIYNGVIAGFSSTADRIDLAGLAFVTATGAVTKHLDGKNTILEITQGSNKVDLTLAGNHTMDKFVVSDDGTGGTLVVDPPAAKPDLSHLVHAIASFGLPSALSSALAHTPLVGGWNEASMLAVGAPHH